MYKTFVTSSLLLFIYTIIGTLYTAFCQEASTPPQQPGMIYLAGGEFEMGIEHDDIFALVELGKKVPHMKISHAEAWFGDETPQHTVTIKPFFLDVYEVTNQQFQQFVSETGYEAEGDWPRYAADPERADHPVVNVTWKDASAYAAWAGKRLPTEAEWEYAAKGGNDVKWFPWGDTPDPDKANYRSQGESFFDGLLRITIGRKINTRPVGNYPANGFGLYDMCGNVMEWCSDTYHPYPGLDEEDWQYTTYRPFKTEGPETRKVARGGHWESPNPVFIRLNNRTALQPGNTEYTLGFRCAREGD